MAKPIYLDASASVGVDKEVADAMQPFFSKHFANSASAHQFGAEAKKALEDARVRIAKTLFCNPLELFFTSGATEANNWAIKGIVFAKTFSKRSGSCASHKAPHIIVSLLEHPSVLEPIKTLESQGLIEVSYLKAKDRYRITPQQVLRAIKPNTLMVSLVYASALTGVIQPVREVGKALAKLGQDNLYFHSDASQALGRIGCDIRHLKLDLMTISAHKIHGPKGVGALFVKRGTLINPLLEGGSQEFGSRGGTVNVGGIVGFARALELATSSRKKEVERLRDSFELKLKRALPLLKLDGAGHKRVNHISSVNFSRYFKFGDELVAMFDQIGIATSYKSACSAGIPQVDSESPASVRFSFSFENNSEQINQATKRIRALLKKFATTNKRK